MTTTGTSAAEARDARIAGLRALADFLEEHPAVPAPRYATEHSYAAYKGDPDEYRSAFEAAHRALDGEIKVEGTTVTLKRTFGPVTFTIYHNARDLCEKRQVVRDEYVLPEHLTSVPAGVGAS